MRACIIPLALLASLLGAGCGGESEPETPVYPVAGTVTQAGKPLGKVSVQFHPVNPVSGARPDDPASATRVAVADDQGKFTLSTYRADDGAPAGDYLVTVQPPRGPGPEERDGPAPPVRIAPALAKYAKKETSPLKATVKPGENPPFDFDLK